MAPSVPFWSTGMSIHSAESSGATGAPVSPHLPRHKSGRMGAPGQRFPSLPPGLILHVGDVLSAHGSSREMAEQRGSFSHSLLSASLRNAAGLEAARAAPGEEAGALGITECLR